MAYRAPMHRHCTSKSSPTVRPGLDIRKTSLSGRISEQPQSPPSSPHQAWKYRPFIASESHHFTLQQLQTLTHHSSSHHSHLYTAARQTITHDPASFRSDQTRPRPYPGHTQATPRPHHSQLTSIHFQELTRLAVATTRAERCWLSVASFCKFCLPCIFC